MNSCWGGWGGHHLLERGFNAWGHEVINPMSATVVHLAICEMGRHDIGPRGNGRKATDQRMPSLFFTESHKMHINIHLNI